LKEYHNTNKKYGFDHLPPEEYRLLDEEIKSAVEYARETEGEKRKDLSTIKEEDEFNFENSRSGTANSDITTSS